MPQKLPGQTASRSLRAARTCLGVLWFAPQLAAAGEPPATPASNTANTAPSAPAETGAAKPPADNAASVDLPSWLRLDALPFIPVPEVSTAPHEGVTVGLFPIVLSSNADGQINQILAPDILHSQYFGWGARWRTFRNPSDDEKWSLVAGAKQSVEREFDAEYDLGLLRNTNWSWIYHLMYDRSGTGRFYGFGNNTTGADRTTFIDSQIRAEVTAARNFTHEVQLGYTLRVDTVEIESSVLNGLPSIESVYPKLTGVSDEVTEVQQRLVFTYDTRDSVVLPHMGQRLSAFAGLSARALGGSVRYSFLGIDGSEYRPVNRDLTLVGHLAARYMPSYKDAPFWAYSQIGGDRSIVAEGQPLRGYGAGRWWDRNSFSASIEARQWVRSFHFFSSDLKLELAPFIDTGKVFSSMSESPLSHLHIAGGMGFRVVVSPFVVGYLDVGLGKEKLAFFSGIDYPF
jgi:hypothetical protein